jgi:hypothetical protein
MMGQSELGFCAIGSFGPDRARRKATATGWTDIVQNTLATLCAIGAFIRTNPHLPTLNWQILVTEFAIGSNFQHQIVPFLKIGPL